MIEIKCPFCKNDEDVASSGNCLENIDGTLHLSKSHAYYLEVILEVEPRVKIHTSAVTAIVKIN